ncbi:MAG TPA: potassium-transporting ATPase subunit KdpC [Methanobacterium sp.]|nr:potassium-transporting ATPase subunit KdpC [Methanobacterium sp.]
MNGMMKELKNAILLFGIMALILGIIYPLAITGIAQVVFPTQANGEIVTVNGKIVGSQLIGQDFTSPGYFHGRPSSIDYNASTSGGSNYGPTNKKLIDRVNESIIQIRTENGLSDNVTIPADLVLVSGSGLDRYISVESAELQVPRIAKARNLNESVIRDIINKNKEVPFPGIGQPIVNVLKLNIALNGIH